MGIRDAFETEVGLVTATTLHSVGAIGVVVALLMFLARARRIQAGVSDKELVRPTAIVIWTSIAANLVGGFMRTYLPAHPTVVDVGHSPWVQVMILKHAFIFASMAALLHLHYMVAPWLAKRATQGVATARVPTAQAVSVFVVILSVVVASVLGGFAQITPLGEGHDGMQDDTPPQNVVDDFGDERVFSASSSLTSTPISPQSDRGSFQLRSDVVELEITFVHDQTSGATLSLTLTDPQGEQHEVPRGEATRLLALAGVWSYVVTSDLALDVAWNLDAVMAVADEARTALAERFTIAPNTFFEINTQMPEGGTFCWDWTTAAPVVFDVHSHFDGEVQYYIERTNDGEYGCFTNEREGGYSLLWANEQASPVVLDYRVWGEFTVDSYFPPR